MEDLLERHQRLVGTLAFVFSKNGAISFCQRALTSSDAIPASAFSNLCLKVADEQAVVAQEE